MLTYILCSTSDVIQARFAELSSIATANCSTQHFAAFPDMLNKDIFMILKAARMPLTAGFLRKHKTQLLMPGSAGLAQQPSGITPEHGKIEIKKQLWLISVT